MERLTNCDRLLILSLGTFSNNRWMSIDQAAHSGALKAHARSRMGLVSNHRSRAFRMPVWRRWLTANLAELAVRNATEFLAPERRIAGRADQDTPGDRESRRMETRPCDFRSREIFQTR